MSEVAELRQRRQARRAARATGAPADDGTAETSARSTAVPTAADEPTPSMAAELRLRREARRAVSGGNAAPHDAWILSQGVPQTTLTRFRESEGAADPNYDGRQADQFPVEAGTDAVVPLALTSARPQSQWKQPLLEHVRAPDDQIVAVPRENWVHGGYAREPATNAATTPMADTLRDRREQRKTERMVAKHEAQKEMNRALEERAKEERLAELRQMEQQLQARMEEAQKQLDEAQALSRGAKAQVDSQAPASHRRQADMHKDGKQKLKRETMKIKMKREKERERILTQPAEVDTRPSAAAVVQQRLAQTASRRIRMRGGQLDGSGWRKDALVLKHEKFIAAARAGKRPGVDAGDRGGTKRSWLNWEGAGKGGRALAVQQKFARKRPTLRVLARLRREAEAKAHAEVGMAAQPKRRQGGGIMPRRLSLRPSAGYRAGYHEHSERGKNPTVISPWDAGHRQNVHDRKLAHVKPRVAMQLDEPVARVRTSLASDAAAALRQSIGSNWEAEARIRDEKQRRPFVRTPSSVNVAKTLHDKRVQRAVKEVDAGGPHDKLHAQLVKLAKEPGRAGWHGATTAAGAHGPLEGRTVAAVAERAYWHRIRIAQARAGRDNRQSLFGPNAPAFKVAVSQKRAQVVDGTMAVKQKEQELRRQQEFGWVAPVPTAETMRRTSTGLFPKAAAGGTPLQDTLVATTTRNNKTKHPILHARDAATAGSTATERPGWAGAATGGPRDQCPPGSHRRVKGIYLDPETMAAHMKRHRKRVVSARQKGTAALREGRDGTKGEAWLLKENRNLWRQQRMRQQRVFEATAATRSRKTPKSLGGGGETGLMNPREQQPPLSKWSAAARDLASHRMRVAELLSQEDEIDNEALTASHVPVIRELKEEAALAVGVYPIGIGEVLSAAGEGQRMSDSEDEEVERLLLKYAAASAGWHSSDDENDETQLADH